MKKMFLVVAALGLAVSLLSIANAGNRNGMGGGCDNCVHREKTVSSDQQRKFQADTIDLRQEMMTKRFEVQRENLKSTPDKEKMASLQADIKALQARILDIRSQSGLPTDICDGECGQMISDCDKKGKGDCRKSPCGDR